MICTSIANKEFEQVLELLKNAPMAEIRLDLLDLDLPEIASLFSAHSKLIATCRPGKFNTHQRKTMLKTAIHAGAAFVDTETDAPQDLQNEIRAVAQKQPCKIILSYHNFEQTPQTNQLHEIIKNSFRAGANIAKIACQCHSNRDAARLMALYTHFENIVAIGMGNDGKITRLAAPFLGAPFTFAATDSQNATAPGQFTAHELETIFQIIQK